MTASHLPPLPPYPTSRLRRNRRDAWSRKLVAENTLGAGDLIWPVFVHETASAAPVESMPGRLAPVGPGTGRRRRRGRRARHPDDRDLSGDRPGAEGRGRQRGDQPRQPRLPRRFRGEKGGARPRRLMPMWRSIRSPRHGHDGVIRDGYVATTRPS